MNILKTATSVFVLSLASMANSHAYDTVPEFEVTIDHYPTVGRYDMVEFIVTATSAEASEAPELTFVIDGVPESLYFLTDSTTTGGPGTGEPLTYSAEYNWRTFATGTYTVRVTSDTGASQTTTVEVVPEFDYPIELDLDYPSVIETGETVTLSGTARDLESIITEWELLVQRLVDDNYETVATVVEGSTSYGSLGYEQYFDGDWTAGPAGTYYLTATVTSGTTTTKTVREAFEVVSDGSGSSSSSSSSSSTGGGPDCGLPAWDSGAVYTQGDQVQYNGTQYEAKWWTQGQNPEANSAEWDVWTVIGPC